MKNSFSFKRIILLAALMLAGSTAMMAQDRAPGWLLDAASRQVPTYTINDVPAVQLLNEESITVSEDGTILRTVRRAVKILQKTGRDEAVARVAYKVDTDKVRDLGAWLIKKGVAKEFGKKETVDVTLSGNDFYNDSRAKVILAKEQAEVGDVFGFESVMEEKSVFSQFSFPFQFDLPSLQSRFSLTLPTGWKADSKTFNSADVVPSVNGSTYVWEMRDLKPIPPEPSAPEWTSLAPRLSVGIHPTGTSNRLRTFTDWNSVAKWMAEIEDPQANVNDALAAKVQDLTAGAKTDMERITALSRYVQGIQYISIQKGLGTGGGYVPHLATDVFARSYGDCKDKANLLRAMLKVVKIESYLVSITADDPTYVRAEWPSPQQFNHCIIAIKVAAGTESPAIVTHPTLGRLLIFDATDPYTPVGDLPEDEQGSWALIDHPESNELIKMPVMPPAMNSLDREINVTIQPTGDLSGVIVERSLGQAARLERARLKRLSSAEYNQMIDGWIARGATGAKTTKIEPKDSHQAGKFELQVGFSAPRYAQVMQDRLMVFKPAIIGRLDRLGFKEGKRYAPYMIDSTAYTEKVIIKLPDGFAVDEMPEPVKLTTDFGNYNVEYSVDGGNLILKRSLTLNRSSVPVEKYDTVTGFFGRVHAAEQSPVVLIKK